MAGLRSLLGSCFDICCKKMANDSMKEKERSIACPWRQRLLLLFVLVTLFCSTDNAKRKQKGEIQLGESTATF